MSRFIHAKRPTGTSSIDVARSIYGAAFAPTDRADLEASITDWSELSDAERQFAFAHLVYLSIEAQASTHALLEDIRDGLEELELHAEQAQVDTADAVDEAVVEVLEEIVPEAFDDIEPDEVDDGEE
jgi:urease gamma subunit